MMRICADDTLCRTHRLDFELERSQSSHSSRGLGRIKDWNHIHPVTQYQKISFGLMGPFSFHLQENGFCFLLMPSWLLMAPLIMEEEARLRTKKEQAWLRAEEEAEMKSMGEEPRLRTKEEQA
jgi:hypothetical protein